MTEATIRRHQVMVWRFLRFLGAPPDVAEDLTQDTFVALMREPPEDRGDDALARWLRTSARNRLVSHRRTLRSELARAAESDVEAVFVALSAEDDGAGYRAALEGCVAELDRRERESLRLRYESGASREEMAARLGMTPEGVKTLLRRVKSRLRACIERRTRG